MRQTVQEMVSGLTPTLNSIVRQILTNDVLGILNSSPSTVDTGSQRAEAVVVRWAHLDQCYVQLPDLATEQVWDFTQEYWRKVSSSRIHGFSAVGANEEGITAKYA